MNQSELEQWSGAVGGLGDNLTTVNTSKTATVAASTVSWSDYTYAAIGLAAIVSNSFVLVVFRNGRRRQSALIVGVVVAHLCCALAIGGVGVFRLINVAGRNQRVEAYKCMLLVAPLLYPLAFECMGFLLCVIGLERLLALACPNWFRRHWREKACKRLTIVCYALAVGSLCVGIYVASLRTSISWSCGHQQVFGQGYILYSCLVSVVGGTVAVSLTLIALCIGSRRIRALPLLSGESGRYQKQIRLTKSMLSVAFCDFALVVVPNFCTAIALMFPLSFIPSNVSVVSNTLYCVNALISVAPFLAFNGRFRADALRLMICWRRTSLVQKVLKSAQNGLAPTNDNGGTSSQIKHTRKQTSDRDQVQNDSC